jgi:hypothetical protein
VWHLGENNSSQNGQKQTKQPPSYCGENSTTVGDMAFVDDGHKLVIYSTRGHFSMWTWGEETKEPTEQKEQKNPGHLQCLAISKFPDPNSVSYFLTTDAERYPVLLFTDHGAYCPQWELVGGAAASEVPLQDTSQWVLLPCGVFDSRILRWNNHCIRLPDGYREKEDALRWIVHGRTIL